MTKFLQANRSEIGLVDGFDLSEIYTRDSRFALSNMLLDPDGLDQIYKLSADGLTKEDIRTVGGLEQPLIHSLGISDRVLEAVSNDLSNQITTDRPIGEPGKQSFVGETQSDNVVVFAGGIAANKIEYSFLDENGELRTTTVPTSRESLFDSIKNEEGLFETASYPGLFRIRRRSHVNQIKLSSTMLIEKSVVIESPTDLLKIPVYMQTTSNPSPGVTLLETYATKNSPIVLPVRISSTASISFSRSKEGLDASSPPFVFGWELKRFSDNLLVRGGSVNTQGNISVANISINVSGTVGAGVDCLLYVYLDPEVITVANLSNIGLKEIGGGQDIGLVGFNSLEELDISGNQLTTFPVWLKTLNKTLKKLNIRGNPYWNNGIVSYFDYQDFRGTGISGADTTTNPPLLAATQILGYGGIAPSGTTISGYAGTFDTVRDTSARLFKDTRANAVAGLTQTTVNAQNGFRVFDKLTDLDLGWQIRIINPDFSRLFPNLKNLRMDRADRNGAQVYRGLIPKMKNSGGLMTLNVSGHQGNVGGSIKYLGDTLEWDANRQGWTTEEADQFIGKFEMSSFNADSRGGGSYSGGVCTDASDVPGDTVNGKPRYHHITSGNVVDAWSGWLTWLGEFNARRTDIAFKIASGTTLEWKNLKSVDLHWIGDYGVRNKVQYNANLATNQEKSNDVLNAPQLTNIQAWRSGWWGRIFSIEEAPQITTLQLGANEWLGYGTSDGKQHLLPTNFVKPAVAGSASVLRSLSIHNIWGSGNRDLEFRTTDFQNLPNLTSLELRESYIVGVFPNLPNNSLTTGIEFSCWIRNNRFRNLNSLGSSISPRVRSIWGPNQGSGVGGALLPQFAPQSTNTVLRYVNFNNSLSTRYSSNWINDSDRGKLITPALSSVGNETFTPSVTWTSKTNDGVTNASSDKLFRSASSTFFPLQQIQVGDDVFDGSSRIGTVTQIDRNHQFIYINSEVSLTNRTLSFTRKGQDISNYFNNHINLNNVYIEDCRLVGRVPEFQNCVNVSQIFLSNNLLSDYVAGTLKNLTGVATNRRASTSLNRFMLTNNALSVGAVRRIISDLHDIAIYFAENNLRINLRVGLLGTKLNLSQKEYQNWIPSEIFNQTSTSGDGNTIPDPLQTKFDQLGPGALYPGITVELF
jgi:hypothetical protein